VLSRDQIMDALKGHPLEAFDRSIDVHISRIRALIEDDPKNTQARAHRARCRLCVRQEAQAGQPAAATGHAR
jgi:DNA-binding response OmpR family regulator